ncbi:MAG: hypothetical protein NUW07_02885 [Candidatus Saccharicenans sp.]|jgi:type II secretory pathway component PulC|nr:hypothetical protein [Candidatus Saccharicenans sp.]MDH7492640.1 hypothetical protein [Candidatus Saccharicenans sp.]
MKKRNRIPIERATSRRLLAGFLVILLFIPVAAKAMAPGPQANKSAAEARAVSSFIKKELLTRLKPEMASVKRDPFRPVPAGGPRMAVPRAVPSETDNRPPKPVSILEKLSLSCSGLVTSGNKKIALILVDGQAITLAEGEELIPGIRLTKISADEVIFQDDQGNSRKVRVKER